METKDLTTEDYKKHIRNRYTEFIDTDSEKNMMFIKIEIVNLLNRLNEDSKKTTVYFLEILLNQYIEKPMMKDEDAGMFLTNLEFFYREME